MLIITEKPSVARQFSQALGAEAKKPFEYRTEKSEYVITHCMGHLLELWDAKKYDIRMSKWNVEALPVIPKEFRYNVIKTTAKILEKVKELINEAVKKEEEIMVATDAGREGEVIARLVLEYAKAGSYGKLSRFWVSESVAEKKVVERGIKERKLLKNYDELAKAGMAWKKSDWIYGINMTVLFTLLAKTEGYEGVMNSGRVQTAVLNEIRKKQKEIENFKPEDYQEFEIMTEDGIRAFLIKPAGGKDEIMFKKDSKYVEEAVKEINKFRVVLIKEVKKENESQEPPQLYNTSDLQKEAYRLYGFNPAKTLELMQKLYEGKGVLSYPRTPSRVLGEGNEEIANEWLEEQLKHEGIKTIDRSKYTLSNKRLFDNGKLEDHYGLVPLKYMKEDGTDEHKVWKLVQERFLMQGMGNLTVERTRVLLERSGYNFVGKFKRMLMKGWKEFERKKKGEEEEESDEAVRIKQGVLREVRSWSVKKKKTKPPKPYNYSSIIAFMQNPKNEGEGKRLVGIGTEATRAAHVKGLETHGLIKNKKGLYVTEKGEMLIKLAERCNGIKESLRPEETTKWEEIGEKNGDLLLEKTKDLVMEAVKYYKETVPEGGGERKSFGKCPLCGKRIYEGKKTYFCENFKDEKKCKFIFYKEVEGIKINGKMLNELLEGKRIKEKGSKGVEYELRIDEGGDLVIKKAVKEERKM